MEKRIITISREFGSGGRFIGEEAVSYTHLDVYKRQLLKITGIWLSFPVTETATFVLALLIFRAGRKTETLCSGTKTQ